MTTIFVIVLTNNCNLIGRLEPTVVCLYVRKTNRLVGGGGGGGGEEG